MPITDIDTDTTTTTTTTTTPPTIITPTSKFFSRIKLLEDVSKMVLDNFSKQTKEIQTDVNTSEMDLAELQKRQDLIKTISIKSTVQFTKLSDEAQNLEQELKHLRSELVAIKTQPAQLGHININEALDRDISAESDFFSLDTGNRYEQQNAEIQYLKKALKESNEELKYVQSQNSLVSNGYNSAQVVNRELLTLVESQTNEIIRLRQIIDCAAGPALLFMSPNSIGGSMNSFDSVAATVAAEFDLEESKSHEASVKRSRPTRD